MDFISDITLEDLKEIGITKLGMYTTHTYIYIYNFGVSIYTKCK